jgi:uncharacterized protein (TIGR01777 family)
VHWTPDGTAAAWAAELDAADAVVNLAGEPIAASRWSDARRQRILDSRLQATRSLVEAIQGAVTPPPVFVSGSAVGYYGPLGDEIATEERPAGSDFLARVCVQWEAEAQRAVSARTRVVCIRTGLVLERDGGALAKMLTPFRFGAGGPVGSGRQYWPWIHRVDWIDLVRWTIATPAVSGAVNATAPNPVTNADSRRKHRPSRIRSSIHTWTRRCARSSVTPDRVEARLRSPQRRRRNTKDTKVRTDSVFFAVSFQRAVTLIMSTYMGAYLTTMTLSGRFASAACLAAPLTATSASSSPVAASASVNIGTQPLSTANGTSAF